MFKMGPQIFETERLVNIIELNIAKWIINNECARVELKRKEKDKDSSRVLWSNSQFVSGFM